MIPPQIVFFSDINYKKTSGFNHFVAMSNRQKVQNVGTKNIFSNCNGADHLQSLLSRQQTAKGVLQNLEISDFKSFHFKKTHRI